MISLKLSIGKFCRKTPTMFIYSIFIAFSLTDELPIEQDIRYIVIIVSKKADKILCGVSYFSLSNPYCYVGLQIFWVTNQRTIITHKE